MIFYIFLFIFMTITYLCVSYKKRKIINLLFYQYISSGILIVFLNIIRLSYTGELFAFCLGDFYLHFYFVTLTIITAYLDLKKPKVSFVNMKPRKLNKTIVYLFALIIIAFWIVNWDVLLLAISNPRMFYASTRLNGGIIYYVIIPMTMFIYFYALCSINFNKKYAVIKMLFYTLIICVMLYIFGQKASFLTIGILMLATMFYKNNYCNKRIIRLGILFALFCMVVFVLYSVQQRMEVKNIFYSLANYSDYIVNFNDLVKYLDSYYYGRIFLENEFFSYIPRALWTEKPVLFGSLQLGLNVPRLVLWTKSLTGAPSFGPIGPAYADFGFFGIILHLVFQTVFIKFARYYEYKLEKRFSFWDLFMMLTFVGIPIFYVTLTFIPLYQLAVICIMYILSYRPMKKGVYYEVAY